jgi:hypothetical protein
MEMQSENETPEAKSAYEDEGQFRDTVPINGSRVLTAFRIPEYSSFLKIVPAPAERFWMDFTTGGWANRCLPLRVANQAGWQILNNCDFEAVWSGKHGLSDVRITFKSVESSPFIKSSFGYGVLTWYLPYLFRTEPGYNLLVRGPSNNAKDGIAPLEGLVETDWAVAMFTVNWRFTRPFHKVKFERDEPICTLMPQKRGELESFAPEIRNLEGQLLMEYREWLQSRQNFVLDKEKGGNTHRHQGHYTRGETVHGHKAPEHQTKLVLAEFIEREPSPTKVGAAEIVETSNGPSRSGILRRFLRKSK